MRLDVLHLALAGGARSAPDQLEMVTDADDADECGRGQLLVASWEGSAADTPARHQADKLASHLASVALEMAEAASEFNRSKPLHFRIPEGQVGQESHLHPAVLEPAALRSAAFRDVHEPAENGPF